MTNPSLPLASGELDHYESWLLAVRCLRVQIEAGRKLSPREMIEHIDKKKVA